MLILISLFAGELGSGLIATRLLGRSEARLAGRRSLGLLLCFEHRLSQVVRNYFDSVELLNSGFKNG